MPPLNRLRGFPIAAALILLPIAAPAGPRLGAAEAAAPPSIVVPLEPAGASGVDGRATIAPDPNEPRRAVLAIEAEGLPPGAPYFVHLHAGSPARPSAGFGLLGELAADDTGRARLETTHMTASATGETADLTLDLLADGEHFLDVHAPGMAMVAVAEIPPALTDSPAAQVGPTGLDAVDEVVGAVLAGDVDRLADRVRTRSLPCGPDTPEGFALAPPCEPGEVEGTPVAVFPAAACEVYWPRDPRPVLHGFVQQAGPLYAVVRTPADRPANSLFPTSEYLVIFEPKPDSHVFGLALYLEGDSVVAAEVGCRGPQSLMHVDEEPLPVVWGPAPW